MVVDLNKEMAWVTYLDDNFQSKWHPVMDEDNEHQEFDSTYTMEHMRHFSIKPYWGIARTSQMLLGNAERDNL